MLLAVAFVVSFAVEVSPGLVEESAWRTLQALCFAAALVHIAVCRFVAPGEARLHPPLEVLLAGGTALALGGAAVLPMGLPRLGVAAGLALQLTAVVLLPRSGGVWGARSAVKAILGAGVLLDLCSSLIAAGLFLATAAWLGPDEGLRLRFLRLARAACGALPVLVLLFHDLPRPDAHLWRTGRRALLVGMVSMPLVLLAAGVVHPAAKYALPLPALALVLGSAIALGLASRARDRLAAAGWSLILASMLVGVFVGVYAFEGPLPAPAGMTSYSEPARLLVRLGHAYAVLLGIALLWAAGPMKGRPPPAAV